MTMCRFNNIWTRAVVVSIVAAVGTFCGVYWVMSVCIPDIIWPGIVESVEDFIHWLRDTWLKGAASI